MKGLIELLNKCWMCHDGFWFFHTVQQIGINHANSINQAAIRSLAPLEIARIRKYLRLKKDGIENFQEFKDFFLKASELFIPDFMNATLSFPEENVLHWEFKPKECFAYNGMQRIGVIEGYECGVIYRIACWVESLGIKFEVNPKIQRCCMIDSPYCSGNFTVYFP